MKLEIDVSVSAQITTRKLFPVIEKATLVPVSLCLPQKHPTVFAPFGDIQSDSFLQQALLLYQARVKHGGYS